MKTHDCPGKCGQQVINRMYACRPCWFRLPADIRSAIDAAWNQHDTGAHLRARVDAATWYRENPRATQ